MLRIVIVTRSVQADTLRLRGGDVDWPNRVVKIERQHYPGKGGLVVKQTKGRRARIVPILDALEPILERLTADKDPDDPLLRGPRGGVLTPRPSATPPAGTTRGRASVLKTSPGTASATPGRPGWPTPASPCTCSRESSATSPSRPPRATCTPTIGTSPRPPDRPTSSSPHRHREGSHPAATCLICDAPRPRSGRSTAAGASSCPQIGPLHRHLLVHFTASRAPRSARAWPRPGRAPDPLGGPRKPSPNTTKPWRKLPLTRAFASG